MYSMLIFRSIVHRFWPFEEIRDLGFIEKGFPMDTEHIKDVSINLQVMLNNSNKAIYRLSPSKSGF
jgi:hypothetical protein